MIQPVLPGDADCAEARTFHGLGFRSLTPESGGLRMPRLRDPALFRLRLLINRKVPRVPR